MSRLVVWASAIALMLVSACQSPGAGGTSSMDPTSSKASLAADKVCSGDARTHVTQFKQFSGWWHLRGDDGQVRMSFERYDSNIYVNWNDETHVVDFDGSDLHFTTEESGSYDLTLSPDCELEGTQSHPNGMVKISMEAVGPQIEPVSGQTTLTPDQSRWLGVFSGTWEPMCGGRQVPGNFELLNFDGHEGRVKWTWTCDSPESVVRTARLEGDTLIVHLKSDREVRYRFVSDDAVKGVFISPDTPVRSTGIFKRVSQPS